MSLDLEHEQKESINAKFRNILSNIAGLPTEDEARALSKIMYEIAEHTSDEKAKELCSRMIVAFNKDDDNEIMLNGLSYQEVLTIIYGEDLMFDGLATDIGVNKVDLANNISSVIEQLSAYSNNHEGQHEEAARKLNWKTKFGLRFYKDEMGRPHCFPFTRVTPP